MQGAKIALKFWGLVQILSNKLYRLPKQPISAATVGMLPCFKELGIQHQAHHSRNISGSRDPAEQAQFFVEANKFIEVATPLLNAFTQHRCVINRWSDA